MTNHDIQFLLIFLKFEIVIRIYSVRKVTQPAMPFLIFETFVLSCEVKALTTVILPVDYNSIILSATESVY